MSTYQLRPRACRSTLVSECTREWRINSSSSSSSSSGGGGNNDSDGDGGRVKNSNRFHIFKHFIGSIFGHRTMCAHCNELDFVWIQGKWFIFCSTGSNRLHKYSSVFHKLQHFFTRSLPLSFQKNVCFFKQIIIESASGV